MLHLLLLVFVPLFVVKFPNTWADVFAVRNAFGKSHCEWSAGSKCVNLQVWKIFIRNPGLWVSFIWLKSHLTLLSSPNWATKKSSFSEETPAGNESGWVNDNGVFLNHERGKKENRRNYCSLWDVALATLQLLISYVGIKGVRSISLDAKKPCHRMHSRAQEPVNSIMTGPFMVCFIMANEDHLHCMNLWNLSLLIHC